MEQTKDSRASQFLILKISIDVQHGNAAAVMATILSSQDCFYCPTHKMLMKLHVMT